MHPKFQPATSSMLRTARADVNLRPPCLTGGVVRQQERRKRTGQETYSGFWITKQVVSQQPQDALWSIIIALWSKEAHLFLADQIQHLLEKDHRNCSNLKRLVVPQSY